MKLKKNTEKHNLNEMDEYPNPYVKVIAYVVFILSFIGLMSCLLFLSWIIQ